MSENVRKKRIAILASGSGSNFEAVVTSCERGEINGEVCLLIYDRRAAFVSERANNHNIPARYLNKFMFDAKNRANDTDNAMLDLLNEYKIDLVVLAGYLSQIGTTVVNEYKNRIINTHPALIPSFCGAGMFGHNVHEAVVEYGAKVSGCTIHFVDNNMDTGPIILQETVPVTFEDSADDVAARVLVVEHRLLPAACGLFCEDRLEVVGRRVKIK